MTDGSGGGEQWNFFYKDRKSFYENLLVRKKIPFPHSSIWIPKVFQGRCVFHLVSNKKGHIDG